ncbi:MAG: hypothetical protein ABNH26_13870 [Celeribacter sp.]|jgi:hypothetical protein
MTCFSFFTPSTATPRKVVAALSVSAVCAAAPAVALDLGASVSIGGGSLASVGANVGNTSVGADVLGGGNVADVDADVLGGSGNGGISADACVGSCGSGGSGSGSGSGGGTDTAGGGGSTGGNTGGSTGGGTVIGTDNGMDAGRGESGLVTRRATAMVPPIQAGPYRCAKQGNTSLYEGYPVMDNQGRWVGTAHSITLGGDRSIDTLRLMSASGACTAVRGGGVVSRGQSLQLGFGAERLGL